MIPVLIKDIIPCNNLIDFVQKYRVFRFVFKENVTPPEKYHYPRAEHCITFYLRDIQRFRFLDSTVICSFPRSVIVGMFNTPVIRYGGNDFLAIKVVLHPTALYRLTGFPIQQLTNTFIDAEEVFGKDIRSVNEQLNQLDDLVDMLNIIQSFLIKKAALCAKPIHPIDKVARSMLLLEDTASLSWLADQSCLSVRQFIRKFENSTGVSPKMFSRLIRFNNAFLMKNRCPNLDWMKIAIACGYYDYQHMVRDFNEFTQLSPPVYYQQEMKSPERILGIYES